MANEIKTSFTLTHNPPDASAVGRSFPTQVENITQTGSKVDERYQDIGTSEETIAISGDIGTYGLFIVKNLDNTNYVDIGFSTGVYGIRLKAGEQHKFRLVPGVTLYALANTASVTIQRTLYED